VKSSVSTTASSSAGRRGGAPRGAEPAARPCRTAPPARPAPPPRDRRARPMPRVLSRRRRGRSGPRCGRGRGERQDVLAVEVDRRPRRLRALGREVAARGPQPPAAVRPVQHRSAVEREHATEAVEHRRRRRRAGEPEKRLSLRAGPRALRGASRRERDEAAHDPGDGEKDKQRKDVLAFRDRERMERRREVPVDEEEAAHGREERRQQAARGRDTRHEQQEQEQDARQPEVVAQPGDDHGQDDRPDDGHRQPQSHPPAG
jgi:hypothetical protein